MTLTDSLHYWTIGNPLSKSVIGTTASMVSKLHTSKPAVAVAPTVLPPLWKLTGANHYIIRLAGVSGAAAVILAAYGSHNSNIAEKPEKRSIFETANKFHFFHSIALLGLPLAKYPLLSATLMAFGTALFSGTLYYRAFTDKKPPFARMAPMGGTCLILAWISLIL